MAKDRAKTPIFPWCLTQWQCITKNAPYSWRNFHACAITRFQKPQQLDRARIRDSVLVDHHARASRSPSPISAASAVASCGWNYCWWINWQRRLESWSSSSSLQRGWSATMATHWLSHCPACSIRYQSLHVFSSANDSFKKFTGARFRRPHHSHFWHGRQNRRSSFCRCRTVRRKRWVFGDNREVWKTFVCQYMHHHVHAVAGALRMWKPNVAFPHPDVSTGWPVWLWCDRRWVRTPQMPPFVDQTDLFNLHSSQKRSYWSFWSALKTMAVNHGLTPQLAASYKWSSFRDCQGIFRIVARKDFWRLALDFQTLKLRCGDQRPRSAVGSRTRPGWATYSHEDVQNFWLWCIAELSVERQSRFRRRWRSD